MSSIMNKKNICYYLIGLIFLLFSFVILSLIINDSLIFPDIITILKKTFILLGDATTYNYIKNTLLNLIICILLSFFIGIFLGIISGVYYRVELILKPIFAFIRFIPIIVIIVISMIIFGFDKSPLIACSLFLIPGIYEGTKEGVKNIDRAFIDVYKLNSNISLKVVLKVYLPLISSYSKAKYNDSIGLGLKVLVTTEYVCGLRNTIGKAILNGIETLEYDLIYAYSIILVVLILILEYIPTIISISYAFTKKMIKKHFLSKK